MVQTDCFAYKDTSYWFEDEYYIKQYDCGILEDMICAMRKCPFYKKKGTEREVRIHERDKRTK